MRLSKLQIERRASWETNPGQLAGAAKFESPNGEITITLDDQACAQILQYCAGALIRTTTEAAQVMADDVVPALPNPN